MSQFDDLIRAAAEKYGLAHRTGYLSRAMGIESKGDPSAYNKGSKASGLFQFIPSTGRAYGLDKPFDPASNIDAAVRLSRDNEAALRKALGREPTDAELYLAHNQGAGGATSMLTKGAAKVSDLVPAANVTSNFDGNPNATGLDYAKSVMAHFDSTPAPDPAQSSLPVVADTKGAADAEAKKLAALFGKKPAAAKDPTTLSSGGAIADGFSSGMDTPYTTKKPSLPAPDLSTPGGVRDSSIGTTDGITGGNAGGGILDKIMSLFG